MNSKEKRPKDWSAEERMSALIETGAISAMSSSPARKQSEEVRTLKIENKNLKKDLNRKEKALAETAALLVLKKKSRRFEGSQGTIDKSRKETNRVEPHCPGL